MAETRYRTLEFALGVQDYAEYSVFMETRSRFRARATEWLALFSIGPVAVGIDLAFGVHPKLYEEAGGVPGLIALSVVIGGGLVALCWLTRPAMARFAARRRFTDGTFEAYAKPQTVEISPAGIRYEGGAGQSLTPWSSIVDIAAESNAIYFLVTSLSAYMVPRRAFAGDDDFNEFSQCARHYVLQSKRSPA